MNVVNRISVVLSIIVAGCAPSPSVQKTLTPAAASVPSLTQEVMHVPESFLADILSVDVTGRKSSYQFNVQVWSPDSGCDQYADWWEVLSENGQLLYRRVLLHSHVSEQPFTRSGGPVLIDENTIVIVRAHMNKGGYGGRAMQGSVLSGFESIETESGFAADVEALPPLPEGCAF